MLVLREILNQIVDRGEDRIQRIFIAAEDHPAGQRARAVLAERIEGEIHDFGGILRLARANHRFLDRGDDAGGHVFDQRLLQPLGGSEMMQEIGVGAADPRAHGLQRHRLRADLDQQLAGRLHRGGARFFGAEATAKGCNGHGRAVGRSPRFCNPRHPRRHGVARGRTGMRTAGRGRRPAVA